MSPVTNADIEVTSETSGLEISTFGYESVIYMMPSYLLLLVVAAIAVLPSL